MASKRGKRRKSCGQKKRYETREEALAVWRSLQRRETHPMRVYPCRFCRGYHVGHMPHKNVRAMENKRMQHG
jgi:hypothetical protein